MEKNEIKTITSIADKITIINFMIGDVMRGAGCKYLQIIYKDIEIDVKLEELEIITNGDQSEGCLKVNDCVRFDLKTLDIYSLIIE